MSKQHIELWIDDKAVTDLQIAAAKMGWTVADYILDAAFRKAGREKDAAQAMGDTWKLPANDC